MDVPDSIVVTIPSTVINDIDFDVWPPIREFICDQIATSLHVDMGRIVVIPTYGDTHGPPSSQAVPFFTEFQDDHGVDTVRITYNFVLVP
jgi:hypothetical protein